ncbi:MAG: putative metalloprotease CJM1_0395 family protein [Nitrospinaceae bacterium]
MKIEIVQGRNIFLSGGEKPCKECEEETFKSRLRENLAPTDKVTLSGQSTGETESVPGSGEPESAGSGKEGLEKPRAGTGPRLDTELTAEEKRVVDQLRTRDREVRAHEQAHKAAAGQFAKGPPSFEYQTGPDGRRYAVGGEVAIDSSPVPGNPQAAVRKAQTIKRAATAPRNPSAQDRRVAAQAAQMEAQARQEIRQQRAEEQSQARGPQGSSNTSPGGSGVSSPGISDTTNSSPGPSASPLSSSPGKDENSDAALDASVPRALAKFQLTSSPPTGNLLDIVS